MIKINTKKEVNGDTLECGYRILEVSALEEKDLPYVYLHSVGNPPHFFYFDAINFQGFCHYPSPNPNKCVRLLEVGEFYTKENFEEKIKYVQDAAVRLKEIKEIKALKEAEWKGEALFIFQI